MKATEGAEIQIIIITIIRINKKTYYVLRGLLLSVPPTDAKIKIKNCSFNSARKKCGNLKKK